MAGQSRRPFDVEEDWQRAEVQVAGRVVGMTVALCHRVNLLTGWGEGASGDAVIRVEWTLFDRIERRTLLTVMTEGAGETEGASRDGEFSAVHAALHDAARQLGRNAQVRHLLSRERRERADLRQAAALPTADAWSAELDRTAELGRMGELDRMGEAPAPDAAPRAPVAAAVALPGPDAADPADTDQVAAAPPGVGAADAGTGVDAAPRGRDRFPALALRPPLQFDGPLAVRADRVQAGGVLVAAGTGHGSGFFIDGRGWVLTNAHVVGNARRVRVVTADGSALIGTVERLDRRRDVALVKVPDGAWAALPVRGTPPAVSEEVFALGAPLAELHRGTLTRGIVSALRLRDGGQPFIQADVTIQPGSSGGPLLDAGGNVMGIAVSGYGDTNLGLNNFIPISDALRTLNIVVETGDE